MAMGVFGRNRRDHEQVAALRAEVAELREACAEMTNRLGGLEARPLPRPHPITPEAFDRVEALANDAARSATIARADVAVRVSNLDAAVSEHLIQLRADHDLVRATVEDLSATVGYQADYLESHADQLAVSLQANGAGGAAVAAEALELRTNQTRIANDVARLTIELRAELARLASIVTPGDAARGPRYPTHGDNRNGDAHAAATTDGDAHAAATSNGDAHATATTNGDAHAAATTSRDAHAAATTNGDADAVTTNGQRAGLTADTYS
jgi:hypothetical protein